MYDELRRDTDRLEGDVIALAQELVRIPSVTLAEGRLAGCVEDALLELKYDLVTRDEVGNVVGVVLRDHTWPTVLLTAHLDTVAPGVDWSRPPFAGTIEGGRLYGLGAADCKGGLAAQLYAGHLLATSLLPLRGNLVFAATVAEEDGGSVGLRHLLERTLPLLELEPGFAVLGEPTGLDLCYGHDGWTEAEIAILGDSPARVEHALDVLRQGLGGLGTRRDDPGAPCFTVHTTDFGSPGSRQAVVRVRRRLLPGEAAEKFLQWLRRRASEAQLSAAVELAVRPREEVQRLYTGALATVRFGTEAWATDPFDPKVDRAAAALRAAGRAPVLRHWRLGQLGMGTAGGTLVRHGIPTVGLGPGEEDQAHRSDESVDLGRVVEAVYATALVAYGFIGATVFPRDLREAA